MKFAIIFTAIIFSSLGSFASAQDSKFNLSVNRDCQAGSGDSSIPVLSCIYSLGLKEKDVSIDKIRITYNQESIPFQAIEVVSDAFVPEVITYKGYYALVVPYVDDSLDGFTSIEMDAFFNAIASDLKSSPVAVNVEVLSSNATIDKTLLGKIMK